ncbi:DUF305 domain-containing protein [Amorphoplanes digitatis]|uniref:Uncharacterized protein (DUF305 family) n=1 Tax=Actinoplanes digitatis TaxID=1868 RepID=A0A7W7MQ30_9ACTN|nr:DUF305 domain-containing protein [Actinoplanes digitatis]MBB4762756.1 uncharacterized protein (DUF305 family) [Actinoplanes digitatis]BFE71671.1 hypothetical protein GCM10020092_049720 [Actinoplanes digitatis]GID91748.1 hypothetical protein Adi01nite_11600 [Actinoplanes digitatis]
MSVPGSVLTLFLAMAALAGCAAEAPRPEPVAVAATVAAPRAIDVLFARMMVAHHAQAVRLSRILLARPGVPERVHHVAGFIAQDQQREIDEINAWLIAWGRPAADPADPAMLRMHGGDAAAHGMLTEDQLREVGTAAPAAAARSFLRQMIAHHTGAITMARSVLETGGNRYIRSLAAHVVNEQTAENDAMRALLVTPLPG